MLSVICRDKGFHGTSGFNGAQLRRRGTLQFIILAGDQTIGYIVVEMGSCE